MADVLRDTDSSASTITISQEPSSRPNTVDVESITASTLVEESTSLDLSDGRKQLPETVNNEKKAGRTAGHNGLRSKNLSSSEIGSRRTSISTTSRLDIDVPCTCLSLAHPSRQPYRCFLASIRRRISYIGSCFTSSQQSTLPTFQHNRSCYQHMNLAARQQLMDDLERMKSSSSQGNYSSDRNVSSVSFHGATEDLTASEGLPPYQNQSYYRHMNLEARHKLFDAEQKSLSPPSLAYERDCPDNAQRESPIKHPRADEEHELVLGPTYDDEAMARYSPNFFTATLDSVLRTERFTVLNDLLKQYSHVSVAWKQQKLSKACFTGATRLVECLLDNDAEVRMSHLQRALWRQDYDIFDMLLSSRNVYISEWQRQVLLPDVERLYPLDLVSEVSQLLKSKSTLANCRYDSLLCNWSKERMFIDACRRDNLDFVKYMLERGTDARCREIGACSFDTGRTALHIAAREGHVKLAKLLIEHGACVNDVYSGNRTPLHEAAFEGDAHMTKLFLQFGASVNVRDELHYQPIHLACIKGSYYVVKVLLEAGAEIHSGGYDSFQPIHLAARDGNNPLLINLLVANGADIKARTVMEQYTPLHLACESNANLSVRTLLDLSLGPDHRSLETPFTHACGARDLDIARCHVQHGARSHCGPSETPLQIACKHSTTDVVDCLLQHGANPHCGPGETPLQIACRYSTADVVNCLPQYGAYPNRRQIEKALQIVHKHSTGSTVKLLLVAGSNPNVATGVGTECHLQTPLGIATCRRDLESVSYLLEAGADPNGANASGFAPIHLLAQGQTTRAHSRTPSHKFGICADPDSGGCHPPSQPPRHSVKMPMSEVLLILQLLQQHNLNCSASDHRGFQALHYLVTTDYSAPAVPFVHSFVKHLLAHGADIDALTDAGDSPLDHAVKSCKPWLVEILVRAGARRFRDKSLEPASLTVYTEWLKATLGLWEK